MADHTILSDADLLTLMRESDQAAFTQIYDRFSGLLYVYAFKLTGSEDDARDILQDIFISFWDRRQELELRGSLSAYLYSAVRFRFLKAIEKEKVRSAYSESFL